MKAHIPLVRVSPALYATFERHARECLDACRTLANDGTPIYMPDDSGRYNAMWTRDFCYMVEGAGRLMPADEILAGIDFLLAGQREDGVIPDRVYADGRPVYLAGPEDSPLGDKPPTDNAQFMAKLICAYVRLTGDRQALYSRMDQLIAAMASVPLSRESLVVVSHTAPHASYGFTDCIAKTGKVFFSSLLYWEACELLGYTCRNSEFHDDAHYWYELSEKMGDSHDEFIDDEYGLYMAASESCRQIDIWGNAYAAVVRLASKKQARIISEFLIEMYEDYSYRGFIRHLIRGEYWERTIVPVAHGAYQNGGYWALPVGWVARTMALRDEEAAWQLLDECAEEFEGFGVSEWISPNERAHEHYAANACAVLGSIMPSKVLA